MSNLLSFLYELVHRIKLERLAINPRSF